MNKEKVSQIIGQIDEKYINEAAFAAVGREGAVAETGSPKKTTKRRTRVRWGIAAACLVLLVALGSAAAAFAVEAGEYRTAVSFFEENGLSTEGLSRSEIKEVYRDITEKRFTYGKTAEVLMQAVPGWEIEQEGPTPKELSAIWDKNVRMNAVSQNGVSCRLDTRYVYDEKRGFEVFERSILEYYRDGEKLWSAEFTDFYAEKYVITKDGIGVMGFDDVYSTSDTSHGWVALVDVSGSITWQKRLEHGFKNEYAASVLNNGDGTWAVFSRGDLRYLCLSRFDADGNELAFHKTEVGNLGIRNAARLGDGYIIQLWNQTSGDTALLYKMDGEGVLTDKFTYEEDGFDYYITDMAEFEGRVYLSAYAVPKQKDDGGRHEIADILDLLFSETTGLRDISSEELTPVLRDNYTAILLLCDPDGGEPATFYSVKGSLGGKLSVNGADRLEWKVESIVSAFFSPATSSFTVGGTCKVYAYDFDSSGRLIDRTDTGETVPYRR